MMKCTCGHGELLHVKFGRERPCIDASCSCEDFDFGGADTALHVVQTIPIDEPACPPDGDCRQCLHPPCPNGVKTLDRRKRK